MITLKRMNSVEFQKYIQSSVITYAKEKVLSGNWKEEGSIKMAKEEYTKLLPNDEKTENNYLYTILNEDQKECGMMWLARRSVEEGFIYEINIMKEYQGLGYGKEAMKQIEEIGRQLGMKKISLHVFGHNQVARGLYEKLGYQTTNVKMEKEI